MKNLLLLFALFGLLSHCTSKKDTGKLTFEPFSKATVRFQINDAPLDTLFTKIFDYLLVPGGRNSADTAITSSGSYYLTLLTDRPHHSILSIDDSLFNIVLIPNDTVGVIVSTDKGKIRLSFDGAGSEINEYLMSKKKKLRYTDLRYPLNGWITSKASFTQVLLRTDSLVNKELMFLKDFLANQYLPDWYVKYERAEIEYVGAGFKISRPWINEKFNAFEDSLPSNYYDFLRYVEINNTDAIFSEKYFMFLDEFFMQDLVGQLDEHSTDYKIKKIVSLNHAKSRIYLSGSVRTIYDQILFSKIATITSDSIKMDSLLTHFDIQDHTKLGVFFKTKKNGEGPREKNTGDQVIEFFAADERDSLISIRDFSNKIVYLNLWATWCGPCIKNIPELNKVIDEYGEDGQIVFLNVCLFSEKNHWQKIVGKYKPKGVNVFAEKNWASKLGAEFNIQGMPNYVLLDKGNILFENHTDKAPMIIKKLDSLLLNTTK